MTNKELILIAKARKEKGLTQKECAKLLGISPMYLCDIEKGRRCPQSEEFYNKVREVLGLNFVNEKVKFLSEIANMELRDQLEAERVKLETAIKCLKQYADEKNWDNTYDDESASWEPLWRHRRWKEEFGYKLAQKTLKELDNAKKT